ncbi:hypothetical protein [Burkholderia glumae]
MTFISPPLGGFFVYGDSMKDHEKTILELIIMGGLIGVAKVLVGSEQLTFRKRSLKDAIARRG